MSKFPVHTLESAPEASRPLLAQVEKAWSFIPNLHATLAESPAALEAYEALFAAAAKTSLTAVEQQVVFLAVSVLHGCEYCTMAHTYLARTAGAPEPVIAALRASAPIDDARLSALRTFTETVVHERGAAGDAAVERFLGAGFTKANVLDVLVIVATKTISNYTNHLTHTPKEAFMSDPALAWTRKP